MRKNVKLALQLLNQIIFCKGAFELKVRIQNYLLVLNSCRLIFGTSCAVLLVYFLLYV